MKVLLGGTQVGTATETSTPGTYTSRSPRTSCCWEPITLPSSPMMAPMIRWPVPLLNITFAPLMQQVYVVPGAAGDQVTLNFDFLSAQLQHSRMSWGCSWWMI